MHSVTISILFLAAQLLGLRADKNPPHIPEQFNATLAPSPLFNRQLDLLNIQVFSHFNSTNGTTQPLLVSENDTNKTTSGYQLYYNTMAGFLYLVSNKTCQKIPIAEVNVIALLTLPSFISAVIITGINTNNKCEFIQTYSQCPHRKDIPCTQWRCQSDDALTEVFNINSLDAYLMENGDPIVIVATDSSTVLLRFETFFSGPQPNSRFIPADADKCHPEKQETKNIFI